MLKELQESKKKSARKSRVCMFDDCNKKAIKSHVLQKNGILREISVNNHLIQPLPPSPFEIGNKGAFDFKRIGVNDVFTFKGFCREHDNDLFEPLESNENLDFKNEEQKALLCYRGLCQEIRRKELAHEWLSDMIKVCPIDTIFMMQSTMLGYKQGIKNLTYFKTQFEKSIKSKDFSAFTLRTIKIPKIELCISVPLNIDDNKGVKKIPFTTSFLNVFPKDNTCYVIAGFHNSYKCNWTNKLLKKLSSGKRKIIFKELSDLVTTRLEFWTMSPNLFNKISERNINQYKKLFTDNLFNHSKGLETDLNLFKHM